MSKAPLTANVGAVSVDVKTAATKAAITSTADITAHAIGANKNITINGVTINSGLGGNATAIAAINNVTNQTGVVASQVGTALVLTQRTYGSAARIDVTSADTGNGGMWGTVSDAGAGVDAVAEVSSDGASAWVTDASWPAAPARSLRTASATPSNSPTPQEARRLTSLASSA